MQEVGLQVGDVRQRGPWKPARRSHLIHHDHEDIRLVVALGDVRRAHKWVGGRLLGRHRRRYYSRRQGGRIGGHYIAERVLVDRKSTRLNSSHLVISYAVFCLKKKTKHSLFLTTQRHAIEAMCTIYSFGSS